MVDVTDIPTELWREIVASACTDGGFTGRSLALTSRFFHAQSLYDRFHSLSFSSLQQMEDFLAFCRLQPSGYQPRIKHLYLSFLNEPVKLSQDLSRTYSRMTPEQRKAHETQAQEERACWDGRFCVASIALLLLAAPALRTLCVVEDGVAPLPLIFPCEFPYLAELSWKGRILAFEPNVLSPVGTSKFTATFPTLERIHFITPAPDGIVPTLLLTQVPSITHLRISNVGYMDVLLPDTLAGALGTSPLQLRLAQQFTEDDEGGQGGSTLPRPNTLPRLRQVIIHGTAPAPGGWCGYYDREWARILSRLQLLARNHDHGMMRTLILQRPWWKALRWPQRLRDQWLDRMQGGRGCWVESEAQETVSELHEDLPFSTSGMGPRPLL